ncbi:MAG TPA: hypothetical protein VME69_10895 [Methylocella sp.]|nr:hypothetical protein [Methylocella sp.]
MPEELEYTDLRRFFLGAARIVVVIYVILDSLVSPVVEPLLRWLAGLRLVIRFEKAIRALPPYVILVLLAVPLFFAEPAKIYGLLLLSEGQIAAGLVTLALAYLVSLVLADRIYHAGEEKLKTIPWFARLMNWLIGIRDRLLAFVHATWIWAISVRLHKAVREQFSKLLLQLRDG